MRIAMISPEIAPFAKTGGLADVVETLSASLARQGHRLCLIMPAYRSVLQGGFRLAESSITLSVPVSHRRVEAPVLQSSLAEGASIYFIRADTYFDRESLYGTPAGDYPDNAERFVFFSRAALELLRRCPTEIVHAHDWQSALAVVALKVQRDRYPELAATKTVLTIHNLGFQGLFLEPDWHLLNLDRALFNPRDLEFFGRINLLKGAIVHADKITTVSPSYAQEIMTSEQGFGLDGVLRQRSADVSGILNGVDYSRWNPAVDPFITKQYDADNLAGKNACKQSLQSGLGLTVDSAVPLLGLISRLTPQKGVELLEPIVEALVGLGSQVAILGSGDAHYERFFSDAAARFPGRIAARIGFDEVLAHQIEAGADIFLMPSLYEPCGLSQMFSLKYGTIPVVRSVGGLKDTVTDHRDGTGTGFVFRDYDPRALLGAIERALRIYPEQKEWTALQRHAMSMDFSWDRSADAYGELYRQLAV